MIGEGGKRCLKVRSIAAAAPTSYLPGSHLEFKV